MTTRFGHVCFFVADLPRAEAFYCGYFDLVLEKRVTGLDGAQVGFYGLNGSTVLELWESADAGAMHGHLAFWVEEIHALSARLQADGIAVSDPDLRPSGNTIAFLKDPDGNTIELLCAPKK